MGRPVTLETIREAADQIRGIVARTPTARSRTLSEITGADVVLKFENLQFTGAFKERGALVKLLSLPPDVRAEGVIAISRGNHALAVAHHSQRLGIPATIVMPRVTPNIKVEHTRSFGAEVILHGEGLVDASAFALDLARERKLVLIHPYDDLDIIRGQGTIALEMLEDEPGLDALIIPIGGGGLIAGNAVAAKGIRPDIEVVGVEAARFPAMKQKIAGEPVECGSATLADGIAVRQPGELTLPLVRELVSEILLVDEAALEEAVLLLLEIEKTVVEGAGAAGLAALLRNRERFRGKLVGLVLSGGNIDLLPLASVIQRGLVRTGRLVRIRVEVPDVPGGLADVTRIIGDSGGGIVDVVHQRAFTRLSLQTAEVDFAIQARGLEHVHEVLDALIAAGHSAVLT
ncbi:MAG: threonine ammonia-lyase [Myxococcota bacterium]